MNSVELFAGAGGLALGCTKAGFHHKAVIEWNAWACSTIRRNRQKKVPHVADWPEPFEGDVRDFDFSQLEGKVQLISGGPPCQPFSIGGKHRGYDDARDMFPEAVRAVREARPDAFIFENVRGLLRPAFATYLEYIVLRLQHPYITKKQGQDWQDHLAALEQHHTSNHDTSEDYSVVYQALNAASYGVPQRRHRVFFVGFRSGLDVGWSFPKPTHTQDALLHAQWVTGDYWQEHKVAKRNRPTLAPRSRNRIDRLSRSQLGGKRWRTVRDAMVGLPEPHRSQGAIGITNHFLHEGARAYKGHTGSPLDMPAKALKAGVHGVPGGENMLARPDGSVRYFSVREAARLQTIPDDYLLEGPWSEAMRQLGNGVPVDVAHTVASSVYKTLKGAS